MLSALYNLIIYPITQVLEFFYQFIFEATGNEGIAIIGLSLVVTLCTLPLYMAAEKWQETERETKLKLAPGVERIKKYFKGDEQYMILNTYYRQNHYNPIFALRSSLSLLIQIPFFLAAYHFLSELGKLNGVHFLFINNLFEPDHAFFGLNILPIAMTLINLVSGFLYSKGHELREKIQIVVMALVFLVVLYDSPAGLVVYWTMNNIFSLVKNIFYKLKNPKKVLYIILCLISILLLILPFTVLSKSKTGFKGIMIFTGIILPVIPFAIIKLVNYLDNHFKYLDQHKKTRCSIFYLSALALTVLAGLTIPTTIIESEPNNYCYVDSYQSPFVFIFSTFFQSAGFFIFWSGAFYILFSSRTKKFLTLLFSCLAFTAVVNCFAFGGHYGPVEPWLEFMQPQNFTPSLTEILINFAVLGTIFITVLILIAKKTKLFHSLTIILLLSMTAFGIKNSITIQHEYANIPKPSYNNDLDPIFHLSRTDKNVIVIMQDRCFSPFVPYVFDEINDLDTKFDGFTFYPNTVSMGKLTMIGTPGLFGGYDYTPYRMNERAVEEPEKTLQDKHNEAMMTLPLIFSKNGFRAEVANLPYENYLEQPESNMYLNNPDLKRNGIELEENSDPAAISYTVKYKDHETIRHNKVLGTYTNYWYSKHNMEKEPYISSQIFRNFFWFSLFKMVPPVIRGGIYHRDYWMAYNKWDDSARFVDNYSVIDYLPELTEIDDNKGTLILLDNEATHEPILLQAPEYDFRKPADLTDIGNSPLKENKEFSTMCGIFLRYTEFFQYLKDNNCYDNTRIIIVSDHGMADKSEAVKDLKTPDNWKFQKCNFTASLFVKDFNCHGSLSKDYSFMTNADTPYLATENLIKDAKHPFTGKNLKVENKSDYTIMNTAAAQSTRIRKEKAFSVRDNEWYTVKDDIFKDENWGPLNK